MLLGSDIFTLCMFSFVCLSQWFIYLHLPMRTRLARDTHCITVMFSVSYDFLYLIRFMAFSLHYII